MTTAAIRTELHEKIEHADDAQLQEIYGLMNNYFDRQEASEDWDKLPEQHKQLILKGLEQAEAGLGTEMREVNASIRLKYKLNG